MRQEFSRGTVFGLHRSVEADARAAFGRSVTFEDAHAESPRPQVGGRFLDFFRAGEHVAQAAEIIRMRLARVAVEEGVRANHDGTVAVVENRRHRAVMQRRRINENVNATHEREQRADGQAEAVEQRHRVENPVIVLNVSDQQQLPNVRDQVRLGEFDPFGHAFRSAGEKDDRSVLGSRLIREARRVERMAKQHQPFLGARSVLARVFEINQLDAGFDE